MSLAWHNVLQITLSVLYRNMHPKAIQLLYPLNYKHILFFLGTYTLFLKTAYLKSVASDQGASEILFSDAV